VPVTTVSDEMTAEDVRQVGSNWWLFLITGICWIIISLMVLSFDPTSAALIGYLTGFVLIFGGISEFIAVSHADGWKWVHVVLGLLFVVGGVAALLEPFQTFGILALLIGWFLIIKGVFDIVISIAGHEEIPLWGLLLASGIIEVLLGAWALGYPGRSAWLLILWVGLGALFRGIGEIFVAFRVRSAAKSL
jgi:uncharacterized membrane protein HdeD (DUF308 family)